MPPARAARPVRPADGPAHRPGEEPGPAPLVARLDAAEDDGAVDARALAELLGVAPGRLRAALAEPAAFTGEQAAAVARALAVDAAAMRALRRGPAPPPDPDAPAAAAAPRSTLALLDAVLAGVGRDGAGRALGTALLDAAGDAARAAGRPLPPAAHALRARLTRTARADADDAGGPPTRASDAPAADDADDAARAAALVADLQGTAPGYADLFAPLHDDALADLLARHALSLHPASGAPAGTRFVLTPPLLGRRRLVLAAAVTADQRRLVVRAALAACAAGHADDDAPPLASPPPPATARVLDAVALADLVPFWQLSDLRRRGRLGWAALAAHVATAAAALAGDWDTRRAADRAALRVALFRAHQR